MVVYASELHLFQSPQSMAFGEMMRCLQLDAFDLWRTFESFLSFDNTMPRKIREHFVGLERHVVQCLSWALDSSVCTIINQITSEEADRPEVRTLEEETRLTEERVKVMKTYNIFFGRVLHLAAQTVSELC